MHGPDWRMALLAVFTTVVFACMAKGVPAGSVGRDGLRAASDSARRNVEGVRQQHFSHNASVYIHVGASKSMPACAACLSTVLAAHTMQTRHCVDC